MATRNGKRVERDTSAASAKRAHSNAEEEAQGEGKNRVALGSLPVNVTMTSRTAAAAVSASEPMAIDRSASTMTKRKANEAVSKAVISAAGMQAGRHPQASAYSDNPVAAVSTTHSVAKRGASAAAPPVGVATPDILAAMTRGASASLPPMVADEAPPQKRTTTNAPVEAAPVEAVPILAPAPTTDLSADALIHLEKRYDSGIGLSRSASVRTADHNEYNAHAAAPSAAPLAGMDAYTAAAALPAPVEEVSQREPAQPSYQTILAPWGQYVVDIDAPHANNPTHVPDLAEDIMSYLMVLQRSFRPMPTYMQRQSDINHRMRTILVDWLAEVAEEFRLHVQTLHRAVGYVDRFLSSMAVIRGKLQLVGVTCLMLAAKYEEVSAPIVDDYVFITDNTYSRAQVLRMEHVILRVLAFDLGGCTVFSFLERFLDAAAAPKRMKFLALYLCELSLLDGDRFLPYLPATIAAACVSTAMFTFGLPPWTAELEYYTHVPRSDVQVCISDVITAFREAPNREQHFVYNKYRSPDFMSISTTPAPAEIPRLP